MSQNLLRRTLSVEGIANAADAAELEAGIGEVPGLESVDVDPHRGAVEVVVGSDVAVGDARWVIQHLGYALE